jgi:hypothetical protein
MSEREREVIHGGGKHDECDVGDREKGYSTPRKQRISTTQHEREEDRREGVCAKETDLTTCPVHTLPSFRSLPLAVAGGSIFATA